MEVRVKIKTPVGLATGTLTKIKTYFKFLNRAKIDFYVNDENDTVIMDVDGNSRQIDGVYKLLAIWSKLPAMVAKDKRIRKLIDKYPEFHGYTQDDLNEVIDLFENGTSVELLSRSTALEIQEENLTFMDKIKKFWKKYEPNWFKGG